MQIGSHQLENNLILAPMAGVTDKPFRSLCRRMGAGLAVSEMVSSDASLRGSRKTILRLDHSGETGPVSVQILGTDPRAMAEAARINVDQGADIIDINMGCPAKKVCKVAAGSALMQNESLLAEILEAVVNAVNAPVTLKIRTGWDKQNKNAVNVARIAESSGIQAVAVHGRTRACGYSGQAEYETVAAVKTELRIPVIANGDIDSPQKAQQVLRQTGVDGLMIGRPAHGRPWIFRQIADYLDSGKLQEAPSIEWVKEVLLEHLQLLHAFYGEDKGVKIARKHIAWYSKTLPGGSEFRALINQSQSAEAQLGLIHEFFDSFKSGLSKAA